MSETLSEIQQEIIEEIEGCGGIFVRGIAGSTIRIPAEVDKIFAMQIAADATELSPNTVIYDSENGEICIDVDL